MASINCAKYTSGQVGGMSVHFDKDKRLECEHENPHIDKSLTILNSFHDCEGYSEMLHRQKKRVAEVDELHPPERVRKDRITAIMMEIPVPQEISSQGLTDQFLKDTYEMIGDLIGKDNMCGMTTHRDEIHDYIDKDGSTRTSLEHGHAMVVPYARWTAKETIYGKDGKPTRDEDGNILKRSVEREGVNAKNFLTKRFLKELQDRMQDMVMEKYGISYQTSQEPLHMTVEDLKRESARAAAIIERAEQHAQETRENLTEALTELAEAQEGVNTLQEQNNALEAQQRALQAQIEADRERHEKQKESFDHNNAIIEKQNESISKNNDTLVRQTKMIELINSDIEYQQHAEDLNTILDGVEENLEQLPKFAKLFHGKEARSFVSEFLKSLHKVMDGLQAGINRLVTWETFKKTSEPHSEPLKERKTSVMDKIKNASGRVVNGRIIDAEEREIYYDLAEIGGISRAKVDEVCTMARNTNPQERRDLWAELKAINAGSWQGFTEQTAAYNAAISDAYDRLREARAFERQYGGSILVTLTALALFGNQYSVKSIEREIKELKRAKSKLFEAKDDYKEAYAESLEVMREAKNKSLKECQEAIERVRKATEKICQQNPVIQNWENGAR